MQVQLTKIAKRSIKVFLGAENVELLYTIRARGRIQLLKYKLREKPFDVLFYYAPRYWPTIKPVVEELVHRRGDLRLGLASWSSKESEESFLLSGIPTLYNIPVSLLHLFDTRIIYSPHNDVRLRTPAKTPPKARLVTAVMSLNTLDGTFPVNSFEAYDYILCAGPHHLDSFRERALRNPALSGKWLLPAGYPKLDFLLASHSVKRRPTDPSVRRTVVYAPTHDYFVNEGLASLRHYGEAIINALLAEGHRVIFRPHPVSFFDQDGPVVDRICQLHADDPNFSLDRSTDYAESYSLADLMVTDLSGTGFTFSFSFGRPTIFFSPNAGAERGLSGLQFDASHRIGALVRDIDELIGKTSELCNRDLTDEIERFRDEAIFNVGKSAAYIVDCLEDILSGCERPEWVRS
jgi:hypothetical protein